MLCSTGRRATSAYGSGTDVVVPATCSRSPSDSTQATTPSTAAKRTTATRR